MQLLEDHLKQIREEDGGVADDIDDDAMWEGWDVESDSEPDSDDGEWINVDSDDNEDLVISDSDDEAQVKKAASNLDSESAQGPHISSLATTKVCIDFFLSDFTSDKSILRS